MILPAKTFGSDMKAIREKRNWSISEAAKFAGLTRTTYKNYEENITTPDIYTALMLCKLFGLKIWSYYAERETKTEEKP